MANVTNYGDISPAVAAYSVVRMLRRAMPYLQLEKFGQVYALPTNSTQTAKFRRYFLQGATGAAGPDTGSFFIPVATTPLVEGVTPAGSLLTNQDYTATISQYGDYITITDVIEDTHTDAILQQSEEVLGESAAVTVETLRFNTLKAGTNVFYGDGATAGTAAVSRVTVQSVITLKNQRAVTTALNRQNAKKITTVVASSADYNTKSVEASYMAVLHPDLETDVRSMTGFKVVADYGPHTTPFEGEIGSCEQVRYLTSTVIAPFTGTAGGGGAASLNTLLRSTDTSHLDIYPILIFARDAYGIVPLKGKSSMTPMVVNPKPASGDPLAQRGTVGWKLYTTQVILQDAWMARLEVGCTA
jgi:N4-gp56 family major capsid protein